MTNTNFPGIFITIEGVEGSGKSTLRSRLALELQSIWPKIIITREPGATEIGRTIRSMLLDPTMEKPSPKAELLLFCADRAQHLEEIIRPALMCGDLVICDRYVHSTLAYQGYGRGMPFKDLNALIDITTENLLPDLVLLLDIDPATGLSRVNNRVQVSTKTSPISTTEVIDRDTLLNQRDDSKITRFENEDILFHTRVRNGFLTLSDADPKRFSVIDASRSQDEVFNDALIAVTKVINTKKA